MAGSTELLVATVAPANATNRTVNWTTSNAAVATVSGGTVTGVGAGTATITATTASGARTATATITVVPSISSDAIRVPFATSATAINTAANVSGGPRPVVASSDRGVVYVQQDTSANGSNISINANIPRRGNYKVEFIYKASGERATVQPAIGLEGSIANLGSAIAMNSAAPAANVSTLIGSAAALSGTIRGDTLYYHRVLAESVELRRGVNTFRNTVTANGGRWAHLPVEVIITPVGNFVFCDVCDQNPCVCSTDIAVESVTVNKSALTIMAGARETLTAGVVPTNATVRTITWSSSNDAVATVNATTGLITAVAQGSATITATSTSGNRTAATEVTVVPATAENAIRTIYATSTTLRNATVRGGGVDEEENPTDVAIVNSSDGGVFYVQTMSSNGTWFSIDVDVPVRGRYKIDFIYKTGDSRATVQAYIGERNSNLTTLGSPVNMRPSATAVNVSTLIGASDARNSHYYLVTLAANRELASGTNTFRTEVTANGGNWAHLPVQVVLTLVEEIDDNEYCPVCEMLLNECICDEDDDPTSIRRRQPTDNRRGILLENAIVSDLARIEVKTPNSSFVNIRILDNLGNTLFTTSGKSDDVFVWNLTNNVGRFVGNGTYLIIAETMDVISGQMYVHYARIGVRR
jgi:uncharacterized protein YjdB